MISRKFSHVHVILGEELPIIMIDNYGYDIVNITLETWLNEYYKRLASFIIKQYTMRQKYNRYSYKLVKYVIKPRVLILPKDYDYVWRNYYSKKARNAIRRFRKNRGVITTIENPLRYFKEILLCNLSKEVSREEKLPPSYTDPYTLHAVLKRLQMRISRGKAYLLGAFLKDQLVGYASIWYHNGYAYISRFMINYKYRRNYPGEALLDGVIRHLMQHKIKIIQYGYWSSGYAPGVDHFLKQFGFMEKRELALFFFNKMTISSLTELILKYKAYREEIYAKHKKPRKSPKRSLVRTVINSILKQIIGKRRNKIVLKYTI